MAEIWASEADKVFLDKLIPHIDFKDEAVVRCDVPVVKILLLVIVIDIKKITNKF